MPVIDHPVHPSTSKGADFRYGCWNRPEFVAGYFAPRREMEETLEFSLQAEWIEFRMSRECQFDLSANDPNCEGCARRK